MVNIISRSQWGAKAWNGQPYSVPLSDRRYFLVHYHGGPPPQSTGEWVPKNVEAIHLGNGWSGTGYNFMVGQDGKVYEGRGWGLQGAHCPGRNRDGFGVYVAIGGDQEPTQAALRSVRDLYDEANRKTGRTLIKSWHGANYATACPGPKLIAWVKGGMKVDGKPSSDGGAQSIKPKPTSKPKPSSSKAPKFPLPRGHYFGPKSGPASSVSGYYSHRADLKKWQAQMRERGWSITADGLYGPTTAKVARQFQAEKGLPVDGLVGIQTWGAAWTAKVT